MIFHPKHITPADGRFCFVGPVEAAAHSCLHKAVIGDFWKNFSFGKSTLTVTETDQYYFSVGHAQPLPLNGHAYSISVEKDGLSICADSEQDLIHGFMTLLDRINLDEEPSEASDGEFLAIECCQIWDTPSVKARMVHFCIFPETELWELHRFVRLCAALKYTHVILEFWGTFAYDCMKELAWSHAYTKEELAPIMQEARDLGLEIIPMFNHWGHASASRSIHGKHVVLDQAPEMQSYFTEDGWCWNISKSKVRALQRQVRRELCDLCGEGKYFHVGCDEACSYDLTRTENMDTICDYLNEISREMTAEGRRIIMWGDMFLYRHPHYERGGSYTCLSPSPESEAYMLARLSREIIIADWQYNPGKAPVETAETFKRAGFDCLLCPWDRGWEHTEACLETVKCGGLMGLLHTTWHTLSLGTPYVTLAAVGSYDEKLFENYTYYLTHTAALLRKAAPVGGDYRRAGWAKKQIEVLW